MRLGAGLAGPHRALTWPAWHEKPSWSPRASRHRLGFAPYRWKTRRRLLPSLNRPESEARVRKGPSFSAGSSEEVAATMPTRRGGEKGFSKAAERKPSRRGGQKAGSQEKEAAIMPGRHGRQKGLPKAGSQGGHGKCKGGPLPPAKNMMSEEEVRSILSWEKPARFDRKKNKDAGFFNKLIDENFKYQREIKDEFEEKGYVEIPDNFREDTNRMMREAHRKAYLEVFGTEPPAKFY